MHEWDENRFSEETRTEEERCWLSALFHKNDSYQTPIVLNPFRESGNVNYNNERNLTQERLFRLVLDDKSPLKRVLRKKDAKALIFDLNTEYLPNKRRGNYYDSDRVLWEMRQLRLISSGRIYSGAKVTAVAHRILDAWSRCVGFSLYAKDNKDYVANATKEVVAALNYIVYKTLKIINTYPSFAAYKNAITNFTDEQKQDLNDSLREAIQGMYENDSHITLKLRRCLAFLVFGHYTSIQTLKADSKFYGKIIEITKLKSQIDYCIKHKKEYIRDAQNTLGKVTLYKYAKEKPIVWNLNTLMPASFLHTDLLLQNDEGGEVSFNSLSSGEKQMIHAMSAILYQIGNIESAWRSKTKQAHYSKICLVFDEIELYFHPKYQTKKKIEKWYDDGFMGNKKGQLNVTPECKVIFRYLKTGDNLKNFLLTRAEQLPALIANIEHKYPCLSDDRQLSPHDKKSPRSSLYECLTKAFVDLGYKDSEFPNYQLTEAMAFNACPYCNAEEIIYQTINVGGEEHNIMDSELDHFYPKTRVPYLAISLYNLVPSGSICNGSHGKHDDDMYAQKVVNPHSMTDSCGFRFELDPMYKDVLDYNQFISKCKILTIVATDLQPNDTTFKITQRYEGDEEKLKARKIWAVCRKVETKGYQKVLDEKKRELGVDFTFKEWIDNELEIDSVTYKRKLSKFCMDIWGQLISSRV